MAIPVVEFRDGACHLEQPVAVDEAGGEKAPATDRSLAGEQSDHCEGPEKSCLERD
jgi:hypothetical protein